MDIFFSSLMNFFSGFYHSSFFAVIKFLLGIYAAVLFVDLALILVLKGLGSDIRKMIKGIDMPALPKNVMQRKWRKIKKRLESGNASQYKAAILEADIMTDKVLSDMGYKGKNLTERLEKIKPEQLPNYEELKEAHQIRNQIVHEADFSVDKKKAEEILKVYEDLLNSFELL